MNIGILGGGQLGWMTILEGRKLGLRFLVLDKDPEAPASRLGDGWFPPEKVDEFYRNSDLIIWEFEHIEDQIIEACEGKLACPPLSLYLKKSRKEEKRFLYRRGFPLARFSVAELSELKKSVKEFGLPLVLKADKQGYDGKGQYMLKKEEDLEILDRLTEGEFVLERFIDFEKEVSVIAVVDKEGRGKVYPLTENVHEKGILVKNRTIEDRGVFKRASEIALDLARELEIKGLLAVEFFLTKEGELLINEFAPRPHNTGHYTLDGAVTSQFENLLRAVVGLPVGGTERIAFIGMVNILGMQESELPLQDLLSVEGAKVYWYGKKAKPGRKMGHVNIVSTTEEDLLRRMERVSELLRTREKASL